MQSLVVRPSQQNHVDGQWHYTYYNGWTYQDPVNRIQTWCGLTAVNPPFRTSSNFYDTETLVACEDCKKAIFRQMRSDLESLRL